MSKVYFLPSQNGNEISARTQLVANKCQRLQKSNQNSRLVIVFFIICTSTTIGFGTHLFLKSKDDRENLSSQMQANRENLSSQMQAELTRMDTKIEAMEKENEDIQLENDKLASKLVHIEANIEEFLEESIKKRQETKKIMNDTSDTIGIFKQELELRRKSLSRSLDGMNATIKINSVDTVDT